MKKLVLLAVLAMPLVGCAGFVQHITPIFELPYEAIEYSAIATNEIPKSGLFGLYHCKADLEDIQETVDNDRMRRELEFKQVAERDKLDYDIANGEIKPIMDDANVFEKKYTLPAVAGAGAGLGLLAGWLGLKRPKDVSTVVHEAEKVKALHTPVPTQE